MVYSLLCQNNLVDTKVPSRGAGGMLSPESHIRLQAYESKCALYKHSPQSCTLERQCLLAIGQHRAAAAQRAVRRRCSTATR